MTLRVLIFLLLLPGGLLGQGMADGARGLGLGEFRRDWIARVFASAGSEASVKGEDASLTWSRAQVDVGLPLIFQEDLKVLVTPYFSYMQLDADKLFLPARLSRVGLETVALLKQPSFDLRLLLEAEIHSDMDEIDMDSTAFTFAGLFDIRVDDDWMVSPGLFWSTSIEAPAFARFRFVPIPLLEVKYHPHKDFELRIGVPETGVWWRASDWFELAMFYNFPAGGQVRLTQRPASFLSIHQFFGRYSEIYDLTNERWPGDTGILLEKWGVGAVLQLNAFTILRADETDIDFSLEVVYEYSLGGKIRIFDYGNGKDRQEYIYRQAHGLAFSLAVTF